ncbi:hypothetical protein LPJ60_004810 [Coemansia sp. RSA 2675]|nr:hypothetical protein LPJ60_004810 [Coemansia sp. RSA 2675]
MRPSTALLRLLTVPSHAAGLRADRFLLAQVSIPPPLLFKLLRKRAITQVLPEGQSQRLQGSDRVQAGMQIHIPSDLVTSSTEKSPDQSQHRQSFAAQRLPMLFENDALAVLQKPQGLACQGGTNVKYSIDDMLGDLSPDYRLVHRLDRDTTGALVVAKSRLAAAALTAAFRDRAVSKRYIALLQGVPEETHGTISRPLLNTGTMTTVISATDDERRAQMAKPAVTKYRVLRSGALGNKEVSIVELDILTGRKHQIRAHCAQALGCPVFGDHKYSSAEPTSDSMYLHLFEISVPVTVKAPFPASWAPVFKKLNVPLKCN